MDFLPIFEYWKTEVAFLNSVYVFNLYLLKKKPLKHVTLIRLFSRLTGYSIY